MGDFNVYSAGDDSGKNEYTDATYFTVTIPAEVELDTTKNSGEFTIKGTLVKCCNLEIVINSENSYELKCDDNTQVLPYKLSEDKVVFWKDKNDESSQLTDYTVNIKVQETPTISGTYKDYLTFEMTPKDYTTDESKYTLTFNPNATHANLSDYADDTVTISTTKKFVTAGEKYGALPTPKRDYCDFLGWYTEATGGDLVTENTTATAGNTTVYAHWNPHRMTILYHNDGANRINWTENPATAEHLNGKREYTGAGAQAYDYNYPNIELRGTGDITLMEVEIYGKKWENGENGLFNVSRWYKKVDGKEYQGQGNKWALSRGGTGQISDGDISSYSVLRFAKDIDNYKPGTLQEFKDGDVTLDLYPVWPAGAKTSELDEVTDDDTVTLLPEVDEIKPVVIDMPTVDTDTKADTTDDTKATESTAKADTKADDTTVTGSGTKTDTKANDTTTGAADEKTTTDTTTQKPDADTTPDDLMIWDADTMPIILDDYDANELAVVW